MKKRFLYLFLILMLFIEGTFVHSVDVKADTYSWMSSAKDISLGKNIYGIASNNVKPTLMDPFWSYDEYFCVYIPRRMNIKISYRVDGTEPLNINIYNNKGKGIKEVWSGSSIWKYDRSSKCSKATIKMTLNQGYYYINQWDVLEDDESHHYNLKVSEAKKPRLSKVKKINATVTKEDYLKITWKKVKKAKKYQVQINGKTYTTSKTTYLLKKKVKVGEKYRVKVRAKARKGFRAGKWAVDSFDIVWK